MGESAVLERELEGLIVFIREQTVAGTLFQHQCLQTGFEIKYLSDVIRHPHGMREREGPKRLQDESQPENHR